MSVLLGNGDGRFEVAGSFVVRDSAPSGRPALPASVAVDDLDGDSLPDLVTANLGSQNVTVLINLPEPSQFLLAAAAIATLAGLRRRSQSRVGMRVGR